MGTMIQDLRYGLRTLAKSPGFTVVAVTALALGIGANTAIFSVVLVMVWEQLLKLGLDRFPATFGDYFDYRDQNAVFEDIAAFEYANLDLTGSEQPERLLAMRASANLFPLLGRKAALGRTFVPEENQPGRDAVVVLSDALWRRRFGADASLVGKTVSLDGNPFTVVGVMPAGFRFSIDGSSSPDVWAPIAFHPDPARTAGGLRMIARLKPGVSTERAGTDMKTISARLEQQHHLYRGPRGEDAGYDVIVVPLREQLFGDVRRGLLVLLGAVGLVLLIACANVANLLLARATARQKEMAIHVAVGAGRLRLVRQLLTESVLLGLMGGCLGLILAFWGVDVLVSLSPNSVSSIVDVGIDGQALAFTLVIALVTGLIFGLAPALQVSRIDLNESLKVAGRSPAAGIGSRVRQLLVVGEVALSLMLVVGSGLLIKSFIRLRAVHPGFNAEKLITAQISLSPSRFRQNHQMTAFYRQLLDRIATLPEVKSASVVSALPLSEGGGGDPFSIEGRPWRPFDPATRTPQVVSHQAIGLDYFRTMQIPLRAGRRFTERDSEGALPVVVVNETMARGFWARENVIGKRIMLGAPRPGAPWLTIVGVVGDVRSS
ncbi:MAG: hypothetical protein AUI36_32600, partial [Cyanobacteria bacterium 13_1_40CM_2_61_4]